MRRIVAIAATSLFHWLFLQPFVLGSQAAKREPREESGPGASAMSSTSGNYMTLVMVSLRSNSEALLEEHVSSAGVAESDLLIQVASSDPAPFLEPNQFETEEADAEATHTAGDPAVQSKLFGSYTSRIDARINRAWRRPRSAIAPPTTDSQGRVHQREVFTCNARISQDKDGYVTEVELMQCEGSPEWQMSLVHAIQRASPLPSPPNRSVFTNVLTLSFEAKAYAPGFREDEYEPHGAEVAHANLSQ